MTSSNLSGRKMLKRIADFINYRRFIREQILAHERRLEYFVKAEELKRCTLSSNASGVSDTRYTNKNIIVSLTTFGKRLYDVSTTIESVMQGTMLPNKIVLWLGEEHKAKKLPLSLQLQQKRGLEIEYCKDIRSYTKLLPSLKKYPEDIIITIDDDVIYPNDLVENLFNAHLDNPDSICASRIHKIVLGKNGKPVDYQNWEWGKAVEGTSPLNFLTGVGGVLYPPHSLAEDVFDESVFLDICKYADDVWFYSMALKKGTPIVKSFTHSSDGVDFLVNPGVQDVRLSLMNVRTKHLNNVQLEKVFDKYQLYNLLRK